MGKDCEVIYHRIWSETDSRLDILRARVAENKDVMAALDFARWLFWSGLLELLEANACSGFLKVDGANLRWKCRELQRECQERFRLNDNEPHIAALRLQSIDEKLNTMAGYLSKLVAAGSASVQPGECELRVISGGLDGSPAGVPERKRACLE